jgi:hypothetical protein
MKINMHTTTERKVTLAINKSDLLSLLRKSDFDIPTNAAAYVRVPGGGDWSHTNLDIGTDSDIIIEYIERTSEKT